MEIIRITKADENYPKALSQHFGKHVPKAITAIGNLAILRNKTLAVFSSSKCPGKVILQTYDLMKKIREAGITVVSGFHSPMERECLNILLKGKQPIIFCPARSIKGMRIKPEYKKPLDEGRLLILSPFAEKEKRISSERALERNRFIAAIGDSIFIPYAAPNSKTEELCKELLPWNKPVYTLEDEFNANLFRLGAKNIVQFNRK
ncbi:MAG: DNA-processing protein DprA [Thermodesulfovibrionales bacterium]|nr:DNA-processing protein DprA [Thermodesulfovibrionales bacterium]